MAPSLPRRATTLLAACLLELLLVSVLLRSLRSAPPASTTVLVFVSRAELLQSARAPAASLPPAALRRAGERAGSLLPLPPAPDWRLLPVPSGNFPPATTATPTTQAPPRTRPPPDWALAARKAAAGSAQQVMLTRQRLAALDELPDDRQQHTHASFPWSRQPLTRWFDFDVHTLTASLHLGRHCELVLVLILPGFGCVLGHLDDTSRGDLFDPALLPAPLQLPSPLLPVGQKPWSVTGANRVMP